MVRTSEYEKQKQAANEAKTKMSIFYVSFGAIIIALIVCVIVALAKASRIEDDLAA